MRELLVFTFLGLLGAARPTLAASNADTFVLAQIDEITSLDPAYPYDNASQNLIFNVYDTLIGFDKSSVKKMIPLLATQVPSVKNGGISRDGRVYIFRIRKGVRFQDGRPLTPEDARYSLLRFMLMDRPGGPSALFLEPLLGISATTGQKKSLSRIFKEARRRVQVHGQDLVITLKRPFAPFLSIMARWSYVISESWAKEHGDWNGAESTLKNFNNPPEDRGYLHDHMNGSGPFKLEMWNPSAGYIVLDRNDDYWRKPAALKKVVVKTVPEFSTQKLGLETGDVDAVNIPATFLPQLKNMKGVKIADHLPRLAVDPVFFFTFKINPRANPDIGSGRLDGRGIPPDFFSDPDVRKGFACAFDYGAFIQDALKGEGRLATTVAPTELLAKKIPKTPYHYDPQKAAAHLKKAFNGELWRKGFRFTMTYNIGSENRIAAALILKKNVESLNPKFQIDIRGLDWASFLDKGEKRLMPIFIRGWYADYPDAYDFFSAFYSSRGRYPLEQGYFDPKMDRLIEKYSREITPSRRHKIENQIINLGYQDEPSVPAAYPYGIYALRDAVSGFYDNPIDLGMNYYYIRKEHALR